MSDQPRNLDNDTAEEAEGGAGSKRWWLRKRWWPVIVVVGFVAYNVVVVAYEEYQRAGYRAELANLPRTPCVEALTSPPLSELPIYISGGYGRSFRGNAAQQHFHILIGLECTKTELLPYFLQFWSEIESKTQIEDGSQDMYVISYRDIFFRDILNFTAHYFGIVRYKFDVSFDAETDEFLYVTMWPERVSR